MTNCKCRLHFRWKCVFSLLAKTHFIHNHVFRYGWVYTAYRQFIYGHTLNDYLCTKWLQFDIVSMTFTGEGRYLQSTMLLTAFFLYSCYLSEGTLWMYTTYHWGCKYWVNFCQFFFKTSKSDSSILWGAHICSLALPTQPEKLFMFPRPRRLETNPRKKLVNIRYEWRQTVYEKQKSW